MADAGGPELCKKSRLTAMRTEAVGGGPPGSQLQILFPGSCLESLPWLPSVIEWALRVMR